MYKYLAMFLALLLFVAGGAYGVERWQHGKTRKGLNNKLAKVQKMQKETESAYSRLAVENENLEASQKVLQRIIEDRGEEVLALVETNIRLKNRIIKIKSATQKVVNQKGETIISPRECEGARYRVDFSKIEDPIKVEGFTLTNPPYAEIRLKWIRDLKLEVILAKNPDGTYRAYLDSPSSDLVPTNLKLQIDPGVLEYSWYQKIGFGSSITFGETGVFFSLQAFYDVLPNLYVGPMVLVGYVNGKGEIYYGAIVGWNPWR